MVSDNKCQHTLLKNTTDGGNETDECHCEDQEACKTVNDEADVDKIVYGIEGIPKEVPDSPKFKVMVNSSLSYAYPVAMAYTYPTRSSHPNAGSRSCSELSVKIHHREIGTMITACTCDTTCIDLADNVSNKSKETVIYTAWQRKKSK